MYVTVYSANSRLFCITKCEPIIGHVPCWAEYRYSIVWSHMRPNTASLPQISTAALDTSDRQQYRVGERDSCKDQRLAPGRQRTSRAPPSLTRRPRTKRWSERRFRYLSASGLTASPAASSLTRRSARRVIVRARWR